MSSNKQIGLRIQAALEHAGLTKADAARLCDVSWVAVNSWTSGKHAPKSLHLETLSEGTGVNTRWILTGEGPFGTSRHADTTGLEFALGCIDTLREQVGEDVGWEEKVGASIGMDGDRVREIMDPNTSPPRRRALLKDFPLRVAAAQDAGIVQQFMVRFGDNYSDDTLGWMRACPYIHEGKLHIDQRSEPLTFGILVDLAEKLEDIRKTILR